MDEETMRFYQYGLQTNPQGVVYAAMYVRSCLTILSKYSAEAKVLIKQLKSTKLIKKGEYQDKKPSQFVSDFESSESLHQKINVSWSVKIARYLAYCFDGGLLQS